MGPKWLKMVPRAPKIAPGVKKESKMVNFRVILGTILESFWDSKSVIEKWRPKKWELVFFLGASTIVEGPRALKIDGKLIKNGLKMLTKSETKTRTSKNGQDRVNIEDKDRLGAPKTKSFSRQEATKRALGRLARPLRPLDGKWREPWRPQKED